MGVMVKKSLSLAILVVILVNTMVHSIAAISATKSNSTASCNGADDECLIIDVDLEFLMDSEINLRLLGGSGVTDPPVTPKTEDPNKPAANCGRENLRYDENPDKSMEVKAIYIITTGV
ncbi:hypothetical protein F0562_004327 [Nyssa sinensis]|uniref:Phytosulfokine-beta n=1 Tax=Nyssa sinensis TaxID=561372 RepID=A0A5J5BY81_9ASTE|nr:hypothetical protein F0562_004327 [Nyssa sinensis]